MKRSSQNATAGTPGGHRLHAGQLFYGSLSGERNFRILADSGDLSRDERDVVRHYSNLGGSAQTAQDPQPVWAAYPLSRGRRAFSRTVFLGAGGRGNDYLAHVLILDADTLAWLRGDLFVLADLDLFSADKPAEDEALAPLPLDRDRLERASSRRVGADAAFPLADMAELVGALADGPVALAAGRPGAGTDLCRTVLSTLPPDDRRRLSFCSRFSHPRRAAFHLAVHQPEDASLVENGLVGFDRRRNELAASAVLEPFRLWLERAAGSTDLAHPLEPLTGLSLLGRPEEAVATVAALDEWLAALPTEAAALGAASGDGGAGFDLHRRGDPIVRRAQARGLPLLEVARHPLNRRLPATGRLLLEAAVHSLVQKVGRALASGEDPFTEAVEACTATAEGTRPGALLGRLIGMAREAAEREAGVDLHSATHRRGRRRTSDQPGEAATRAFTAAACALAAGGSGGARAIYSRLGDDALWRKPSEAAGDLGAIAAASPRAFLDLATAWFAAWRELEGPVGALDEIGPLLGRLAEAPKPALNLALRALEQAAPGVEPGGPASAGVAGDGGPRRTWHLALMRRLRTDLGAAYPTLTAARLAVEEGLLEELSEAEAGELTPAMVESFPDRLERRVAQGEVPWPVLRRALFTSTAGLLPRRFGGRDWERDWRQGERLERWPLAARVAASAAAAAADRGDRAALAEVAWLVWGATRLASGEAGDPLAADQPLDLLAEALDSIIEAGSETSSGESVPEADIALRALWRLRHLRRGEPRASGAALAALRDDALAAAPLPDGAAARGDAASFAAATRARVAHLAGEGLFPPPAWEAAP